MWRHFLTRGFQQGLKRSICLEKADTCASNTSVKDKNANNNYNNGCLVEYLPNTCHILNHYISKSGKEEQQHRDNHEKNTRNVCHHKFFEAFGWSGALVFGWVISKQLWLTQTWTRDKKECKVYHGLVKLFTETFKAQPPVKCVLPQAQSAPTLKPTEDIIPTQPNLDNEFEEAARELQEIHEKAIGEALNRRGIACLSKSTGSEAISYFRRASEFKYPPASFNMGQCCELGIGTKQDFKEAADWYRIASEQGHPTAMYNLGVFYAHGWGGLQADIATARQLFIKAASLGQPYAKAALAKESKRKSDVLCTTKNGQKHNDSKSEFYHVKSPDLNLFVNNLQNGLTDDVFKNGFKSEKNWDVPLNSAVAF